MSQSKVYSETFAPLPKKVTNSEQYQVDLIPKNNFNLGTLTVQGRFRAILSKHLFIKAFKTFLFGVGAREAIRSQLSSLQLPM